MTTRDFNAISGLDKPPKAEFTLGYDEEDRPRKWHVRGSIPALGFIKSFSGTPDQNGRSQIVVERLVETAIVPEEVDDFLAMVNNSRTSPLTTDNLQPFADFLMEAMGQRPTQPPSSSEGGSNGTGQSSRGGSSSPATRRARSRG